MAKEVNSMKKVALVIICVIAIFTVGCNKASSNKSTSGSGVKITVLLPKHEMDTKGFMEMKTREFEQKTGSIGM